MEKENENFQPFLRAALDFGGALSTNTRRNAGDLLYRKFFLHFATHTFQVVDPKTIMQNAQKTF